MAEEDEKRKSGRSGFTLWMVLTALVVMLDQVSKRAVLEWVELHQNISINTWIAITHRENRGAAFSILANQPGWQRWFLSALAVAVSAYIVSWLWKFRHNGPTVLSSGLLLVLAGALGNVIDRVLLGHVIDFFQVYLWGWPFPAFNVADSAISVGAALLLIDALFLSRLGEEKAT